ncbi:MAG TPA: DUF885 domain-containing protein [Candidatus Limnocylindrales bacterium]
MTIAQSSAPAEDGPSSDVDRLADAFWERYLEISPISATVNGDKRYDDLLPDPSPDGRRKGRELAQDLVTTADAIPDEGLSAEDRITRDVFRILGDLSIEQDDLRLDVLAVVDQMGGPQTLLPQLTQFQGADTPEDYDNFVARLHAYQAYMTANAELLREAEAMGLTAPRIVAERTIAQLERMLAIPIDQAIVPSMARVAEDDDREAIRAIVRDEVYPADAAFLEALKGSYFEKTRTEPGIWSAPNGEAIYRNLMRFWTTLDLDPGEVHRSGVAELEEIEAERQVITMKGGFGKDTKRYRAHLAAMPSNIPPSRQAIVDRATREIDRAMSKASTMFGRLPRATCRVLPVEEFKEADAPFAYYFPPSADSSRPGTYYVNTYDVESRVYSKLAATTFHEAVPGHHFQLALDTENMALNKFRRFAARFAAGAFVEGWGLYAERLADEMGLYLTEAERFGMLDAQAWRAARLVVDTGLHALHWTRQQSIDQLLDIGLSDTDAVIETDRYIANPGQALSYKIGQREIERLRRELTAKLGPDFDLKAFHDQVLGHGSLPLAILAAELPSWLGAAD